MTTGQIAIEQFASLLRTIKVRLNSDMPLKTFYDENKKEWSGYHIPLMYHPNVSIGQVVLNSLDKFPNRVIQVNDNNGIEMTTDQLKIRTIRTALHLAKFNLTNDDCIGIVAKNNHNLAPVVIAALLIGVPINPLDPAFDSVDIQHMFNLTKPKVIFCDNDTCDRIKNATDKIGLNPTFITFDQQIGGAQFIEEYFAPINGDDSFIPIQIENGEKSVAIIVCSSATTGPSKAACLSHAQLTQKFSIIWKKTCDDVYLYFSSLYWITGFSSLLYGLITCCKRIITTEKYTTDLFMKLIQKYKVTQTVGPSAYIGLILQHPNVADYDLTSLQYFFCGGSVVPAEYVINSKKVFKSCKVIALYGLSELAGAVTHNPSDNAKSVGSILPNIKMRIVDVNGNYLGVNEKGEIIIQSNYMFLGYKGNPELTKAIASNGWFYTGDIGYFDQHGQLYVVDRIKDFLSYQNNTSSPAELEVFLLKNRFIKTVSVVGIPDLMSGDLPAAVIVKTPGCVESDDEIKNIVYNQVKNQFADHKNLRGGVYIVDDLPVTQSGKVVKRKVKEIALALYNKENNI